MTAAAAPVPWEQDFQDQVTQLAEIRGWSWLHVRALRTVHGWRVPTSGTLAKGWFDLLMVRPARVRGGKTEPGRIIFAELKRTVADQLTPEQEQVAAILQAVSPVGDCPQMVEVFAWRPSDWDQIERVLR